MKKSMWLTATLALVVPLSAHAACENVKADTARKIVANGVPESGFTLAIIPAGGQMVGHCENDTQKIVYTRHGDGAPARAVPDAYRGGHWTCSYRPFPFRACYSSCRGRNPRGIKPAAMSAQKAISDETQ